MQMRESLQEKVFDATTTAGQLVGCFLPWILWHSSLFRIFNAESIFIQIIISQTIQFYLNQFSLA